MGIFDFGKKDKVVDLGAYHRKQEEKINHMRQEMQTSSQNQTQPQESGSGFLGNFFNSSGSTNSEVQTYGSSSSNSYEGSDSLEEKRRKLAQRIAQMTDKLEEVSNQLYHLQQRVEVIEQRLRVNSF